MADKMARADLPLRGGQSTKNASETAAGAGGRSTAPAGVAHTGQGVLRGRETGSQPTGGDVAPTWAHHHHQGAWGWYRRRPEHAVGWRCWLAGDAGTHPDSQSHSLAGSRRRAGKGAARRCPGGAERRQAGRRHSARGPVSLGGRQQAAPLRRRGQLACPTSSCCSNLRAGWAASTLHVPQRPAATGTQRQHATWAAALLGRVPRLPSRAPAPGRAGARERPRSSGARADREVDRSLFCGLAGGAARLQPGCAHLSAPNTRAGAAADATGHAVTQAAAGPNTRVAYRAHACGRLHWTGRRGAAIAAPSVTHVSRPQPLRPL